MHVNLYAMETEKKQKNITYLEYYNKILYYSPILYL